MHRDNLEQYLPLILKKVPRRTSVEVRYYKQQDYKNGYILVTGGKHKVRLHSVEDAQVFLSTVDLMRERGVLV